MVNRYYDNTVPNSPRVDRVALRKGSGIPRKEPEQPAKPNVGMSEKEERTWERFAGHLTRIIESPETGLEQRCRESLLHVVGCSATDVPPWEVDGHDGENDERQNQAADVLIGIVDYLVTIEDKLQTRTAIERAVRRYIENILSSQQAE